MSVAFGSTVSRLRVTLFGALWAVACTTDHGILAKQAGGDASDASVGGNSGGAGVGQGGAGSVSDAGTSEPAGPRVLTLMHGVVDATQLQWCFARVEDGGITPVGAAIPREPLSFGQTISLRALPELDFDAQAVLPYVLTGELEEVADMTCAEALAHIDAVPLQDGGGGAGGDSGAASFAGSGGSSDPTSGGAGGGPMIAPLRLRAEALATLPAGTLFRDRSHLMIATGCMRDAAHVSDIQDQLCGKSYAAGESTLSILLLRASRQVAEATLGAQFVNASLAAPAVSVRVMDTEAGAGQDFGIASNVRYGAIQPVPPQSSYAAEQYGFDGKRLIELSSGSSSLYRSNWQDVVGFDGLEPDNGQNITLVLLGPAPPLEASGWWNPPILAVVANDPSADL